VVSVLKGAVIGGGLELASATHIRVAERSTYYALPEGQRGLFVGGGASVRVPRLMGANRVADLMLTGRRFSAEEGQSYGLSNYLVDDGTGFDKALELAAAIAGNSPISNYAVIHALPRIAESSPEVGFLLEALMAAISQGSDEAKGRMQEFLDGRGPRITPGSSSGGDP
jgi:enoyl-CoA hydratase/carnithine racemase